MNKIKSTFISAFGAMIRRHRWVLAGVLAFIVITLTILRVRYAAAEQIAVEVQVDSVAAVVNNLTTAVVLPPAGDTSVNVSKKVASVRNDSIKIAQDAQHDKNMEKSCEDILAEYKKVVEELIASNYANEAYLKYTSFGMISDEKGNLRIGPKLAACKQDLAFQKAFDEIDKLLVNGN